MRLARLREGNGPVLAAAVVALAAGLAAMSPAPVGVFWDDGVYVISAKALATGEGYRFIHLPGAPAATHYPPLWPALLALVWKVAPEFPANVVWMKLLNPVLLALGAAATAVLGVRAARIPLWMAALIAAVTIAVAPILLLSAVLMSEPLGLALSAAALAAATLVVLRGNWRDGVVAGALVGLAILARSAAVVLLPALAVGVLWRRSRTASLAALAVACAVAVPWFLWSSAHAAELPPALAGSYGPYGQWLVAGFRADPSLVGEVVARNAALVFREVGILVFGALPPPLRSPALSLLLVVTVAGLALGRRRVAPLVAALATYLALVLVWPYAPGRFIWTYFGLYAIGVAAAVALIVRRAAWSPSWRAPAAVAVAISVVALVSVVRYDVRGFQRGWHATAIERMADGVVAPVAWIASNTAPTDTIATDVHLQTYLYTGRIAVPVSTLTVAEYVRPKGDAASRAELAAIDSTFRPSWWVVSAMTGLRGPFVNWVLSSGGALIPVATLPDGGIAARRGTP